MPINFLENGENEEFFERPQIKTIAIALIGVCFFCVVLIVGSDRWKKQNALDNFKQALIVGKITKKALDASNRNNPFLLINNEMQCVTQLVWDKSAVGDSVYKPKNTNDFKIIKKDTIITITANDYKVYLDSIYTLNN